MSLDDEQSLIEEVRTELLARLFTAADPDGVMAATENIRTSMETLVSLGQGNKAVNREELTRLMVGLVKVSSGVAFLGQDALAGRVSAIERGGTDVRIFSCDEGGRRSQVVDSGLFFLHQGQLLEIVLSPRLTLKVGAAEKLRLTEDDVGQGGFDSEVVASGERHTFAVTLRQAPSSGEAFLQLPLGTQLGELLEESEVTLELAFSARSVDVYPLRISWVVSRVVR